MPTLPTSVTYGKVTGRFLLAVGDTVADTDRMPDAVAATGKITFIPSAKVVTTTNPPTTVIGQNVVTIIDAEGYLLDPAGAPGVWLVTGVYTVQYTLAGVTLASHYIDVRATHTDATPLDLATAIPPGGPLLSAGEYATLSARIDAITGGGSGGGAVASVNGRTGAVVLTSTDVGALPSSYQPGWTEVTGKPSNFPPEGHTHAATDLTGFVPPDRLGTGTRTGAKYLRDDGTWQVPPSGGAVTSVNGKTGVVTLNAADVSAKANSYVPGWSEITAKPTTFTPSAHTHDPSDLGTGTANATTILYGDGQWRTAPTGGSGTPADATSTTKGVVQLAGDLGGTAAAPTVPGLAGKANTSHSHSGADITSGTVPAARLGSGTASSGTILYGDGTWKVAPSGAVASVNGLTGAVTLTAASVGAAASTHSHAIADTTGLQAALDAKGTSNLVIGTTASTAKAGNYVPTWAEVTSKPTTFTPATHTHPASEISDASTTGRAVLTASTQTAARTAIGAGTSDLALGTTSSTAKAGDYKPTLADLPAGVTISTSGTTRPTARADLVVQFLGADPGSNALEGDVWLRS